MTAAPVVAMVVRPGVIVDMVENQEVIAGLVEAMVARLGATVDMEIVALEVCPQ